MMQLSSSTWPLLYINKICILCQIQLKHDDIRFGCKFHLLFRLHLLKSIHQKTPHDADELGGVPRQSYIETFPTKCFSHSTQVFEEGFGEFGGGYFGEVGERCFVLLDESQVVLPRVFGLVSPFRRPVLYLQRIERRLLFFQYIEELKKTFVGQYICLFLCTCLLYTSPSPRD
eukprot:TRINITY_DN3307_c0_g2_i2.p1 TRINITY_DN3307_c0_g2~~TRINITY_DN3307_c0_g2_i2.p1  ORF type:complete len:173 (-),score=4.72 TRINITY_DN3307_c0_g2_i2:56-574(-)